MDWADIEAMIDEAIAQKISDPGRIGIAGHSQGGFLAAWGVTRPNNRFKAGVISAGPTDWGCLSITTDWPDLEVSCTEAVHVVNLCSIRLNWEEVHRGHPASPNI